MIKISVIIPVYNVEAFISRCLESVVNQSYQNYEVICVNDGSTDSSIQLLEKYAGKIRDFKLINQQNYGVSTARNNGVEIASGDYLTFIDSDDYVDRDYLKSLANLISDDKYDLICSGLQDFDENGIIKTVKLNDSIYQLDTAESIASFLDVALNSSPVAKLYKRSIIMDNKIKFRPELSLGEDREFNLHYFTFCKTIVTNSYVGYNYRKDVPNSLTHQNHNGVLFSDYEAIRLREELFKSKDAYNDFAQDYIYGQICNLIMDELFSQSSRENYLNGLRELQSVVNALGEDWTILDAYINKQNVNKIYKLLLTKKWFGLFMGLIYMQHKISHIRG